MRLKFSMLVALLAIMLAGCGSSSSKTGSSGGGSGDKTAFCNDNSKIDKATSTVTSADGVVPALKAQKATIDDFAKTAPSDIKSTADVLVTAARTALSSNSGAPFNDPKVKAAGPTVDTYCGQQANGDPIASGTTT